MTGRRVSGLHPKGVIAGGFEIPREAPGNVVRSRCLQLLDEAAAAPLALVVAGAGWGKTSLLRDWAEPTGAAWLTLAPRLGDRLSFWNAVGVALGRSALDAPPLPTSDDVDAYPLRLAHTLAAAPKPVRLVLDEFDHVHDPLVAGDLEQLLQGSGEGLSLVLASRTEPAFRLQRLRLSGLLAELRASELVFTPEESRALFERHGVALPDADAQLIRERTEGWPAGLGLTALALRRTPGTPSAERALADAEGALHDYLLDEVVAREPARRLDLLLRTAHLDVIDGELAAALTDASDAPRLLAELAREGFLAEIDSGNSYRCHGLLRDVLRSESERRTPDGLAQLHHRAAEVFARRGEIVAALRHAVAAGDWLMAATLLGEHWLSLIVQGGSDELIALMEQIPEPVVRGNAELALAGATLALERGDERTADELLPVVDRLAPALWRTRRARTVVTAIGVELYRARSGGDVAASLETARDRLDPDWERQVDDDLRGLMLASLGAGEFWIGEYAAAEAHLEQAVALAEQHTNDYLLFVAQSYAVGVELAQGRLDDVRRHALAVERLAGERGWIEVPHGAIAYLSLAAAHMWAHELDEAERRAEQARRAANAPRDRLPYLAVVQLQATLLQLRGEAALALELLRRAHATAGPLPRPLELSKQMLEADLRLSLGELDAARALLAGEHNPEAAISHARVALAAGDPRAAAATIARFRSAEHSPLRPYANVEAWLLDALAQETLHDEERALHSIEQALDAAEPHGLRHPFFRLGTRVQPLLRRLLTRGTLHRALAEELLAALTAGEPSPPTGSRPLLEPLSERELAVLRCLPTMMSNAEIAAELYVSVNTVKTHLRHIYAKLDATNRREAVRRARELQLLSPGRQAH